VAAVTRAPRQNGAGTRIAAALAVAVALAVLVPQADRGALVARGVSHLLAADLARASEAAPGDSIFGALDALLVGRAVSRLALQLDVQAAGAREAEVTRLFTTQLRRYEAARRADLPRMQLVAGSEAAELYVALRVSSAGERVSLTAQLARGTERVRVSTPERWMLPGRAALLPPLLAVCVALLFGRTLLALFVGIYAGAALLAADAGSAWTAPLRGLWDVFAVYLRREIFDTFRVEIVGFIVALIATVGVTSRAGGMRGLLQAMGALARSVRSALLLTFGTGLLIFFDDYSNCMLVGSTMRPLTDLRRISREKLAYIVDSTAAPVAGISLLSTWIAFMISVYSAQLPDAGIVDGGYAIFLQTLPYRFYCLFTLLFVLLVILTGRDYGPMARAEARAATTGQLVGPGARPSTSDVLARIEPLPGMPLDWRRAALPLALILVVALARIFIDGGGVARLAEDPRAWLDADAMLAVLLAGSGAAPIFAGAVSGLLCAFFLAGSNALRVALLTGLALWLVLGGAAEGVVAASVGGELGGYLTAGLLFAAGAGGAAWCSARVRLATSRPHVAWPDLRRAALGSAGTLVFAVVLLFEAWMIGAVCRDLATADYLVALLSGALPPALLPVLLFVVACLVAFATGSSWSTMSILLPNVVALAASLGVESPLGTTGMVVVCISAVLEGSIFGDHCSPISDTTVLSSLASASDHIDHVRTQIPYALSTAAAAIGCGYLPLLLVPGWSAGAGLGTGAAVLCAALWIFGRPRPATAFAP